MGSFSFRLFDRLLFVVAHLSRLSRFIGDSLRVLMPVERQRNPDLSGLPIASFIRVIPDSDYNMGEL